MAASSSAPAAPSSSSTRPSSRPGAPLRRGAGSSTSDHPHFLKQLGIPAIFSDPSAPGSSGKAGGDNEDWKALFQQQLQLMQVQLQASELESSQQQQQQWDPPAAQQQQQADQGSSTAPAQQGEKAHPARVIVAPSPLETTFRLPVHTAAAEAGVGGKSGGVATAEALRHETNAASPQSLSTKESVAVEASGAWAEVSVSHGPNGAARKGGGVGGHARPAEIKLDHHHHRGTGVASTSVERVHLTAAEQQAVLASRAEEFERAWTAVVDRLIVEGQLRARPVGGL